MEISYREKELDTRVDKYRGWGYINSPWGYMT